MSINPLLPDARAERKARMNRDIIELCSISKTAHACPIAQGIGLYTHVAGPKITTLNPHFEFVDNTDREVALLPLGGPRRVQPSNSREAPNRELAALFREVEAAVKAEEKVYSDQRAAAIERQKLPNDAYSISFDALKRKYGDMNAGQPSLTASQFGNTDSDVRRHSEASDTTSAGAAKKRRVSFALEPEPRRKSTSNIFIPSKRSGAGQRGSGTNDAYSRR